MVSSFTRKNLCSLTSLTNAWKTPSVLNSYCDLRGALLGDSSDERAKALEQTEFGETGPFCHRICPGPALDELGDSSGEHDRP